MKSLRNNKPMKEKAKTIVPICIILLLLGFAFYWYEWRPTQIRKECNKQAYDSTGLREFGGKLYENAYERCLREKGLEK